MSCTSCFRFPCICSTSWLCPAPLVGTQRKLFYTFFPGMLAVLFAGLSCLCGNMNWFTKLAKPCCLCGIGTCWWFGIGVIMLFVMGYASWLVDQSSAPAAYPKAKTMGMRFYWLTVALNLLWILVFFLAHDLSTSFIIQLWATVFSCLTSYFFYLVNCKAGWFMLTASFWSGLQLYCQYMLFCLNIHSSWLRPFLRSVRGTIKDMLPFSD